MNENVEQLMKWIQEAGRIVFFGGAGVSTASGIPDFRSAEGLYRFTPEEMVSHSFFMGHPLEFYNFYWSKMVYGNAKPNACHEFLTYLEKKGKLSAVITQNIDRLHQKAGTKNVIELHGNIEEYTCLNCGKKYHLSEIEKNGIPRCACGEIIRPNVVLYGEALDEACITNAIYEIEQCDLLIVGGTSLKVFPAADFIQFFRGKHLVVINRNDVILNSIADLTINDDISKVLTVDNFLSKMDKND